MSKSTINSVKWNAINNIVSQTSTFITGIVLMRLLKPEDFGLIGMITVFTGFLNRLKDSGLGSSLIFKMELTKSDKDTVFWFNFCFGFLLFILFYLMAGVLANYYQEPILNDLVKVFSFTFLISSLSGVHGPLLQKKLEYKKIFKANIVSLIVSSILTVIAAFYGLGVWSLIILHLSGAIINTINLYFVSDYRPSFNFSKSLLREHFNYSLPVLGTKSFNYWTRNADNFFIGSNLGSEALGYYSRAYFFVTMPVQKISMTIGSILFPTLSIKKNKEQSRSLLLNAMNMTAFVTFPLMGGLIVLSEPFILSFFGAEWKPMILTLQILSVMTFFESVFVFTTSLFFAYGATKLNFRISVIYGIYNIIVFYIGSKHSIEMVATLLLAGFIIFLFPKLYYAGKLIDLKIISMIQKLSKHFFINIICMVSTYTFLYFIKFEFDSTLQLVFSIFWYVLFYFSFSFLINKKDSLVFIGNIKKVIQDRG